jgi:hypothetical protein
MTWAEGILHPINGIRLVKNSPGIPQPRKILSKGQKKKKKKGPIVQGLDASTAELAVLI